jgi:hypothetical protein
MCNKACTLQKRHCARRLWWERLGRILGSRWHRLPQLLLTTCTCADTSKVVRQVAQGIRQRCPQLIMTPVCAYLAQCIPQRCPRIGQAVNLAAVSQSQFQGRADLT